MRLWSSWRARRARLAVSLEMPSSSSARSGLTSSAAAVGVGARRSATKSAMVKSVSWPMPVTTGTGHARTARAPISSLKPPKSSMLPPPRTSNTTSHPPSLPAISSAAAIFSAAPSPWTCTGKTTTSMDGLRRASVVNTSREAAALRDVLTTLARRNPSIEVVVFPVQVQGEGAAEKIAAALEIAGRLGGCDVVLLVRGGGSIEDLWAFNEEIVARAIRACPVPVVTGIGHETDFTIADFVADRRAPTPTAAAELVSPERAELLEGISRLTASLALRARQELQRRMQHVDHLARRLVHPDARLRAQAELLGQLRLRLGQAAGHISAEGRWKVVRLLQRAQAGLPNTDKLLATSLQLVARLRAAMHTTLERAGSACSRRTANPSHLDPAAVLRRGYSVVRDRSGRIVLRSASLAAGDLLDITFAEGAADARVERSR